MSRRSVAALVLLGLLAGACTSEADGSTTTTSPTTAPPTTATSSEEEPPLFLNLMWHQHQPFYPKNEHGVYTRPWVRVHATKDYWDMAAMIEDHPGLEVTFNLTPDLLLQLEDLANGAKDSYWVATEVPADELTEEERQFIVERFFDVNPEIISRFPRFQELADYPAATSGSIDDLGPDDFARTPLVAAQ